MCPHYGGTSYSVTDGCSATRHMHLTSTSMYSNQRHPDRRVTRQRKVLARLQILYRYTMVISGTLAGARSFLAGTGTSNFHRPLLSAPGPLSILSRDRTRKIVGHVKRVHTASNSQHNSNTSPHTHPRELHCGNDPISSPSTACRCVVRPFVIVHQ